MEYMDSIKELKNVVKFSTALFEGLNIESRKASYITMMGLFSSLIEHSSGFIDLMESKSFSSTQTIARAALEVYVDILNLKANGNYANYLWAEYYDREKEIVKSNSKKKDFRVKRNDCYKLYDKEGDFNVLTIAQKFIMADFKVGYKSFYSLLSAHTHSGIFSLLNRIIENGESNKLSQQRLFKNKPSETEIFAISLLTNCLLDACEIIANGHDEKAVEFVNQLRNALRSRSS